MLSGTEPLRVAAVFIIMVAGALGVFPAVLLRPSEQTMSGTPFMCAKVRNYHVVISNDNERTEYSDLNT